MERYKWRPTAEDRFGMHLERQRRRWTWVGTANTRNHQTVCTPALDGNIRPCIKRSESRCITPCQVHSTQRCTTILRKLLTEAPIGWRILGRDCNEPMGEGGCRVGDGHMTLE